MTSVKAIINEICNEGELLLDVKISDLVIKTSFLRWQKYVLNHPFFISDFLIESYLFYRFLINFFFKACKAVEYVVIIAFHAVY